MRFEGYQIYPVKKNTRGCSDFCSYYLCPYPPNKDYAAHISAVLGPPVVQQYPVECPAAVDVEPFVTAPLKKVMVKWVPDESFEQGGFWTSHPKVEVRRWCGSLYEDECSRSSFISSKIATSHPREWSNFQTR